MDKSSQHMHMFAGVLLTALGVLWILTNYDIVDGSIWKWVLPSVVVLLGLKHIVKGATHKETM